MFIERTLKQAIMEASKDFKGILLTGPRQVGKTTLLQNLQKKDRSCISMDDIDFRLSAKEDPAGFINRLKLPVLIDEVQYVPEIFPYIKMHVDKTRKNGLFWLTGSQQFSMIKNVSESLAGRVAIFELRGTSLAEEEGRPQTPPFIPTPECLQKRQKLCTSLSVKSIFKKIWRGSYPQLVTQSIKNWEHFYRSYITTYIERDVCDYLKVDNLMDFRKFMQVAAARTGRMINYREISKDVGVSEPTIRSWFNVLNATGLVIFIQPYFNNTTKRLLKTPKFYFMDTGLCCYLTKWSNPDVLERGAMAGLMLESYVVSEIVKSYIHNGLSGRFYYYKDKEKREIDLLIEQSGKLHPIEIKKMTSLRNSGFKGFDFLKNLKTPIGHGCVLCFHNELMAFGRNIDIVPIGYI